MSAPTYADLDAALRHIVVAERVRQGLSQAALADRIGVDRQYLNHYEVARRAMGLRSLFRVSRALGVPLSRLVERAEEMVSDA